MACAISQPRQSWHCTAASAPQVALVHDVPRTASVKALATSTVYTLHRHKFQELVTDGAVAASKQTFAFLSSVESFSNLSARDISRIADVVEPETFNAGEMPQYIDSRRYKTVT